MTIKKITITFSAKSKPKSEAPMFNIIETLLTSFVHLANNLPSRDIAELLRSLVLISAILGAVYLGARLKQAHSKKSRKKRQ